MILGRLEKFKLFNGGYIRLLPDPYHQGADVGIITWIARELHELIHGEV